VPVIAALDDPLPILLTADDLADMVWPDDDRADLRAAGVGSIMSPGPGKIVRRPRIGTYLAAHVPATPRCGPTGRAIVPAGVAIVMTGVVVMVGMMMVVRPGFCAGTKRAKHERRCHENTHHGVFLEEGDRFCDRESRLEDEH
jgi:hypothetical protein